MNSKTLHVYFCHYYLSANQLKSAIKLIYRFFGSNLCIVVVLNSEHDLSALDSFFCKNRIEIVKGSNILFDFSAYQEALYSVFHAGEGGAVFVNDSVFRKYPYKWMLKSIANDLLKVNSISSPVVVGLSNEYGYILTHNPWSSSVRHLCSACFYANDSAIAILRQLIDVVYRGINKLDGLDYSKGLTEFCRTPSDLLFYSYIQALLYSKTSVWKPEISSIDRVGYDKKALCFYLEHKFTANIDNNSGGFVFINRGFCGLLEFKLKYRIATYRWQIKMLFSRKWKK